MTTARDNIIDHIDELMTTVKDHGVVDCDSRFKILDSLFDDMESYREETSLIVYNDLRKERNAAYR